MRDLLLLAIHLLVTLAKFLGPGGTRQVAAEIALAQTSTPDQQSLPTACANLTMLDRLVLGLTTLFVSPHRIPKLSAMIKPATLFKFHKALVHQKYRLLFSSSRRKRKPGPKGPSTELIAAIVLRAGRRLVDLFELETPDSPVWFRRIANAISATPCLGRLTRQQSAVYVRDQRVGRNWSLVQFNAASCAAIATRLRPTR